MSTGDQILRAHATIASLRTNLPNDYEVDEAWVRQFNEALGKIESALNITLDEFKIAASVLYQSIGSSNAVTGDINYRQGLWCRRETLMHKIDSVLGYFTRLQNGLDRQ